MSELSDLFAHMTRHDSDGAYRRLVTAMTGSSTPQPDESARCCEGYGLWGSLPRWLAWQLGRELSRPVLYITAHIPTGHEAQDDFDTLSGQRVAILPAVESHDLSHLTPDSEQVSERQRLCRSLWQRHKGNRPSPAYPVIVASIQALMQPVRSPETVHQQSLTIATTAFDAGNDHGDSRAEDIESLCEWLVEQDYQMVDRVDAPGQAARHGGIVDVFSPSYEQPIRVEYFGDDIESIRFFDIDSQRSIRAVESVELSSCQPIRTENRGVFLDYLPRNTIVVIEEVVELEQVGRVYPERIASPSQVLAYESVMDGLGSYDRLYLNRFQSASADCSVELSARSVHRFEGVLTRQSQADIATPEAHIETFLNTLDREEGLQSVVIFCENSSHRQRLESLIHSAPSAKTTVAIELQETFLHHGFEWPAGKMLILTHHELFGIHAVKRHFQKGRSIQAIDSFTDLEPGDYVVHVDYGIGRYRGIRLQQKDGREEEYLSIEYAGKAVIHVPVDRIHLVHKYVGAMGHRPKLSKLGTKSWARKKQKVADSVSETAEALLALQAQRAVDGGIAYPEDTDWQRELEEAFPYPETPDQQSVARDIKKDMRQPRPMDRLLCGDVGYGKTELAIRAAFKAVQSGRQVAVLVPTTVLAEQHYRSFSERLSEYPVLIESLSRFKTAGQAREIISRSQAGLVDILIGTHRLLSRDVSFKELGLVIIDEEQRFGVEDKERLKRLRAIADVLTMTATPIPRTLHLALLGLRDISSLSTPPLDRRSIVTEVCPFDRSLIERGIRHELARNGQVFFVHNRVQSIYALADRLADWVPEARVIVAHGQMPRRELEQQMLRFVQHKADVLVCTTIIESGLDIPAANTIFVDEADRYGLAELHQLRGRVGRYKHRAHAYMLLPQRRTINPTAVKRLKAIEEYSQLGAGFRIAMRDLEIRGAGNILGFEQSGHIDAVGYELFCRLLKQAVQRARQLRATSPPDILPCETTAEVPQSQEDFSQAATGNRRSALNGMEQPTVHLELDMDRHIPRSYIASDRQRMEVYRRLATCGSGEDIQQLSSDLRDWFGKPPGPVEDLLQCAEIRVLARPWRISSIVQSPPDLIFRMGKASLVRPLLEGGRGRVTVMDEHTVYLRLPGNYFETSSSLLAFLRRLLTRQKPPVDS